MAPDPRLYRTDSFALWRESQDMKVRTRLGGIFYLLAWLLGWFFSTGNAVLLGVAGCLFFGLLMVMRWLHQPPAQEDTLGLQRWIDHHWLLLYLTSLGWGLTHAYCLWQPAFEPSRMIATLSTIAFSTAMAFNFPMRKLRCISALFLLYLPGMVVLAQQWSQQEALLATLTVYLIYLLLALGRSHQEYQATLKLEQQLLEQRELYDRLSRTDSLTQLGNRLQFNALFTAMVANARRLSSPLSLVLLDIDFFKRINDQHGHSSGDACLQAFAEHMRLVFRRDSDVLLRLGGEEFGVLMPDTPLAQAHELAERFRRELAEQGFELNGSRQPLTTSVGVGCLEAKRDASAEAFFKRVDDALYRAKTEGRDRLALAID